MIRRPWQWANAQYALLTRFPGTGRHLATTDLLKTGPIGRFAAVGHFASCARCVDIQRMTNDKRKGGNAKNGNKSLASAFVEAANFALRFRAEARRFYERKKAPTNTVVARSTNTMVAIKGLAHKLARACFHILKERKPTL